MAIGTKGLTRFRRWYNQYQATHGTTPPQDLVSSFLQGQIEADISTRQAADELAFRKESTNRQLDLAEKQAEDQARAATVSGVANLGISGAILNKEFGLFGGKVPAAVPAGNTASVTPAVGAAVGGAVGGALGPSAIYGAPTVGITASAAGVIPTAPVLGPSVAGAGIATPVAGSTVAGGATSAGIGLGAGLATGGIGYGIGQITKSKSAGAIGGAAVGFAIGGPVGAVIGGVAGLVGGK